MLAGFITFLVFAAVLVVASIVIKALFTTARPEEDSYDYDSDLKKWEKAQNEVATLSKWVSRTAAACAVAALLFAAGDSITIIQAGEGGVVTRLGAVQPGREVSPGPVFTIPFVESVHRYDTKLQKINFTDIEAASTELQAIRITGVLNYRLNPAAIPWLFQNVGSQSELEQKFLIPSLIDSVKTELPDWAIETILANRGPIANDVVLELIADNAAFVNDEGEFVVFFTASEGGVAEIVCSNEDVTVEVITVDEDGNTTTTLGTEVQEICGPEGEVLHLENIGFSERFDTAIETRQAELINIQTAQNVLRTREIEAEQVRATARGTADANRFIAASLEVRGAQVVQLAAIAALGDNVEIILLPADIDGLIPLVGNLGGVGGP